MAGTANVSDDDAPEELTLGEGRDVAEILRKQETDNQKRLAAEAKSKRRQRSEQNRKASNAKLKAKTEKANSRLQDHQELEEAQLGSGSVANKSSGFLDDSIVQFLVARERNQAVTAASSELQMDTGPKRNRKRKKTEKDSPANHRIKLVLLNESSTPSHPNSGSDFLKERLFGSHIHRSISMLPKLASKRNFQLSSKSVRASRVANLRKNL